MLYLHIFICIFIESHNIVFKQSDKIERLYYLIDVRYTSHPSALLTKTLTKEK
jgi:hypothetical protein